MRVLPPPRTIKLKRVSHEYSIEEKKYEEPIDFQLKEADLGKYASIVYERDGLAHDGSVKETNIDRFQDNRKYSEFMLVGEVARYLNISCVLAGKILREATDGMETILEAVNKYNAVLYDYVIPAIFNALYEIKTKKKTVEEEVTILREPPEAGFYEFTGKDGLVLTNKTPGFKASEVEKSFHADTYCFDSAPEKECFLQYIRNDKVDEIYFTGMFTSNQGDLYVYYYDPESGRIRQYYPDFLAKMSDGSYRLIEVKGDDKIDDIVVKAKQAAAEEMAEESGVKYIMYAGSKIMKTHILVEQSNPSVQGILI